MREHPCVEVAFGDTVKATRLHFSFPTSHHLCRFRQDCISRSPNLLSTSLWARQLSDQARRAEHIRSA